MNSSQKNDLSSKKNNLLRKRKNVPAIARVVILTTFNNNIISVSDSEGNVIVTSSSGANGFTGKKKASPYAAQSTATALAKIAVDLGVRCVSVSVRGVGQGRESAVFALRNAGLKIGLINVNVPLAHNGCRPRKKRRV